MALRDVAQQATLRLMAPLSNYLIRKEISPNAVTTVGTVLTVIGGGIYGWGHIHVAGWIVGLSALCDLLDGDLARRAGRESVFGAFYDSTLDRISDAAVLGGLLVFFARNGVHQAIPYWMSTPMMAVVLLGIIGSFLTSYTRARAEGLGIDAKIGIQQRAERIILLSAPQAFFGLMLDGWVLMAICTFLTVTAWITVVQRIAYVYRATNGATHEATTAQRTEPADQAEARQADPRGAADGSDRRGQVAPFPT